MLPQWDVRFALDLAPAGAQLLDAAAVALFAEGEDIMADSQEHYVPVDEGVLRASGHVTGPERKGDEIRATLAYGGAAEAYAVEQHEELSYHHTVGGAKYLERPVIAHADTLARDVAARLRSAVGL